MKTLSNIFNDQRKRAALMGGALFVVGATSLAMKTLENSNVNENFSQPSDCDVTGTLSQPDMTQFDTQHHLR